MKTKVDVDSMGGHEFEHFCAELLKSNGYKNVEVTSGSGDYGVDILAEKDGITYAIQCKRSDTPIGNKAIQEIYSGRSFYNRHVGVVITNNSFTPAAKETANKNNVLLWDRDRLNELMGKQYESIDLAIQHYSIAPVEDVLTITKPVTKESPLSFAVGKDASGRVVVLDIEEMPHLLIAGSMEYDKTAFIHTLITSIMKISCPDDVRFLLFDPKAIEFGIYNGLPHLLGDVIVEPADAVTALEMLVDEMERRYILMKEHEVKTLDKYNAVADLRFPKIVCIFDEIADLMMMESISNPRARHLRALIRRGEPRTPEDRSALRSGYAALPLKTYQQGKGFCTTREAIDLPRCISVRQLAWVLFYVCPPLSVRFPYPYG